MDARKQLQEVYKQIQEKVERSDVKRLSAKSETDISNMDVRDFVRTLSSDLVNLKKVFVKASTLPENTPELEMFVVAYNNLLKVLEDKKKVKTEE